MKEAKKLQTLDIGLDVIDANPNQPRKKFEHNSLEELASSIRDKGVLQPIIVRSVGERYIIIAGERRARASKLAQRETIPAIVLDVDEKEAVELALAENIQREDLSVIEEAHSLSGLADLYDSNIENVAIKIQKSIGYVRDRLSLLNLPEYAQDMLDRGEINLSQAKVILEIPDANDQINAAKLAQKLQLSANQLKGRTQHLKDKKKENDEGKKKKRPASYRKLTGAIVGVFDVFDDIDWSQLQLDQRETLIQQIDALVDLLNGSKEAMGSIAPLEEAKAGSQAG